MDLRGLEAQHESLPQRLLSGTTRWEKGRGNPTDHPTGAPLLPFCQLGLQGKALPETRDFHMQMRCSKRPFCLQTHSFFSFIFSPQSFSCWSRAHKIQRRRPHGVQKFIALQESVQHQCHHCELICFLLLGESQNSSTINALYLMVVPAWLCHPMSYFRDV